MGKKEEYFIHESSYIDNNVSTPVIYDSFSNKTNIVKIITHIIFITPNANKVNISAQQQPIQ